MLLSRRFEYLVLNWTIYYWTLSPENRAALVSCAMLFTNADFIMGYQKVLDTFQKAETGQITFTVK